MSTQPDDPQCSILLQAANYKPAGRKPPSVRLLVIHTAETDQVPGAALAIASWAAGKNAPQASWHYAVAPGPGPNAIIQSVRETDVAWAAPGANADGIQIELAGHASQPPETWLEGPGLEVLTTGARLAGRICKRWGIPVRKLSVDELKAGQRGVIGHVDATNAYHKSTHTDPGKHFPWAEFIRLASEEHNKHE